MADERIDVRARMFKTAGKVFLKTIFGGFLAAFVWISMTMIFNGLGTKAIGEQIYEFDENSEPVLVETIYYDELSEESVESVADSTADEDDTAGDTAADGEEGETSEEDNRQVVTIYSEMSPTTEFFYYLLSILCMVLLLLCMPYSDLWTLGDKDNNNVSFGRLDEDKLRGLKIGLIAGIPSFLLFAMLVVSKLTGLFGDGFLSIYQIANMPYIMVIRLITGNATAVVDMAAWCLIPIGLLTLLVP
ncbi:MAG: hypothetical protein IJZ13_06370, partial [Clostridia bacterium]|nr:hypothetical protein [Clostridia bacterium]